VSHYPFTPLVLQRLVAAGFAEADAAWIVERLFLGPNAGPDELFEVASTVLRAKVKEGRSGSSHIRARSRPSTTPPVR
jgi:hypothetical protein